MSLSFLLLSACSDTPSTETQPVDEQQSTQANTSVEQLHILAGSELKDIEPLLADIQQHTGVQITFDYIGTLDGVAAISAGNDADAAWFSHGKYLSLVNRDKIKDQTSIMLSPVIMGVKQSQAQTLGWLNDDGTVKTDITWQNIADASSNGQLNYAMTNPAASNSGFTALMGVASAFAGTSDAPTLADIEVAKPRLKDFFRGQALTSGSSGWLAEAYVNDQADGQSSLDAIINYESVLMQLNDSGQLQEPLVLVYPKEGIVTADYPLTLLDFDKKDSYDKVVAYLTSEPMQQQLMNQTNRRPVNNQVALNDHFYDGLLVELPFPSSLQVIDTLLVDFANELRNPAFSVFLLDVSGSMQGEGMTQLKQAMLALTGDDNGSTANNDSTTNIASADRTTTNNPETGALGASRFTQFAQNEVVGLKPFNQDSYKTHIYEINAQNIPELRSDIENLQPRGGTAIFDALLSGYNALYDEQQANSNKASATMPVYYYSLVLMTDGVSENGIDYQAFADAYKQMPPNQQNIKTFVVLFGDADEAQMQQVAQLTGGRVFDGRDGNLADVFREIRGYQ